MIVKFTHNHPIMVADAIKHRKVSEAIRLKFLGLFKCGLSSSTTLELHRYAYTRFKYLYIFNTVVIINMEDKRRRRKNRDPSETNIKQIVMSSRCEKICLFQIGFISHQHAFGNVVCEAEP